MYLFEETIRETIKEDKIGTPVFVRWMVSDREPDAPEQLARMLHTAEYWLDGHCLRLAGTAAPGTLTLGGLFENGRAFLLGYTHCDSFTMRRSDLMLLGNRGALYYDDLPINTSHIEQIESKRYQSLVEQIRDLQRDITAVTILQSGGEYHE